jgi:hypothetical protein
VEQRKEAPAQKEKENEQACGVWEVPEALDRPKWKMNSWRL